MIVETKSAERAVRERCTINGENCYILITDSADDPVEIKVPYENRAESRKLRETVETLAATINKGLKKLREGRDV